MTKITIKPNEPVEVALRRFRRQIEQTGLLREVRSRCAYEKPAEARKRMKASAVARQRARSKRALPPRKMY
jgi:small subunit ribosomal protein S21